MSGELVECLVYVLDLVADVVDTVAALGVIAGDGSIGVGGLEELDPASTQLERDRVDGLVRDGEALGRCHTESSVVADSGIEITDHNADVMEAHGDVRGEMLSHLLLA